MFDLNIDGTCNFVTKGLARMRSKKGFGPRWQLGYNEEIPKERILGCGSNLQRRKSDWGSHGEARRYLRTNAVRLFIPH